MCGVAGIFSYSNASPLVDREELRTIRDHMRARGPDGKGEWYSDDNRVGLGHRRLSIIDLSERGAQPMASQDGKLVVSFNGEIYNYRQLRNDLEAKGRVFRSDSDTEVLLHLYDEKGEAMLQELRGMFAFALWDARKNALLLARDPYGIKPLYYADDGGTLRIASQVKAILAGGKVSRQTEPAGLAGFYLFGSVPEPWTLYREISAVPAGGYLWAGKTGLSKPVNYFSITGVWAEAEGAAVEAGPQEQVREALLDSVRHHLVADVPVGAFLSSGIDSGTLVGLMDEVKNRELISSGHKGRRGAEIDSIQTITLAFEEFRGRHDDESPLAAKIAERYGARHVTRYVTEREFRKDLPKILEAMDQPTIDGINTWFVAKAAKEQGLKVAVSGVGGDELFGGYPSFRDIPKWVSRLKIPAAVPGLGAATESILSVFLPL
ncbi:MAG: asparagine synthase (glutamine-hydrolyzing), partial [Gammaproteobacteria bacterium]